MQCPYCGEDSQVVDSRSATEGVRRRRVCGECKRRFTTYERPAAPNVKVLKRAGHSEPFDPGKIVAVLMRVGSGRPNLSPADAQRLARAIEAQLIDEGVKSIPSSEILGRLLGLLGDVDRLAKDRLAADYVDEGGQLRLDQPSDDETSAGQLGLFGTDNADEDS